MPTELLVDAFAGVMSEQGGVQEGLEYVQDQVDPEWREQTDFSSTPPPTKKKSKKALHGRPVETARVEGRIQVHVRIRPLLKRELDCGVCVTVNEDAKSVKVFTGKSALESTADSVFEEQISQADVFEHVKDSTESVLQGFNNTILAYGQTGTGKTYTILGGTYVDTKKQKKVDELRAARSDSAGLVPRLVLELYTKIDALQEKGTIVKVRASYMEVYNEKVFDLLNNQSKSWRGDTKDVKQQRMTLEVRDKEVTGLTFCEVKNAKELLAVVRKANVNRAVRHTAMNTYSSRSHSILQLVLEQKHDGKIVKSKLSLVDLAGSERWDEKDTSTARVQEMTSINQGLSALASVVNALQAKEKVSRRKEMNPDSPFAPVHVPYRDSKLTHLLMDSLGGNCRTTMIATISPSKLSAEESISTLRFADRVRAIQNRAVAMAETDPNAVLEAKEGEIQRLKSLLAMLSSSAEGQEFASIREALEQVSRELESSRQELDEAKKVLEEERRARQDLQNTLTRFNVHGSANSSFNTSSGFLPELMTPKSDSHASDELHRRASDSSDTHLPPIGGRNSPREEPVTEAVLDLSSSPRAVDEAPSTQDPSPTTPPQPVVNPLGALAASLQSQGVEIDTKKRPEPVKQAPAKPPSPPKQPPAEPDQVATAAGDESQPEAAAQHATQHASAPAAAVAPTIGDGAGGCAFIEGWNPDQPKQQQQQQQPSSYDRPAEESRSGRRNQAQQAASLALDGTNGDKQAPAGQGLDAADAAEQPEVQDFSAGSKQGYEPAARRASGSEEDQYQEALAGDARPQDQTVSKEFIAIGGILGEITKIRTELRTIIGPGDAQPGNQQHGRHVGGGERAAHPREAAMMQKAYDRNGMPRNAKGSKGSYQYVHAAYGYNSATNRPAPLGGRSSAMVREGGRNRRPSAVGRTGRQGAPRGTSYSAPGGSEVYFSPALHRAALGGGASEPGRVMARRQGGIVAKLSPINHKQPSMAAPTPMARRAHSNRAAPRATVPTVSYPKPQGIPNHMGVGTWMYIMGPHASSSRAMQLAELESVAGFDAMAEKAPAHLLRAGR